MFHKRVFGVLLTVTCVEGLYIERDLRGDIITDISHDECLKSENTKLKYTERGYGYCKCKSRYETAVVEEGKVKCKNRSDILKLFDSSRCTIFGYRTDKSRISMVQETFYLKDEPKKLLQNCSESTRSEIDLIYPQKKVIPVTWYYWRQTRPYIVIGNWNKGKYAGYLFRLNNVCNGICVVAKFTGEVYIDEAAKQSTTTTTTTTTTTKTTTTKTTTTTTTTTTPRTTITTPPPSTTTTAAKKATTTTTTVPKQKTTNRLSSIKTVVSTTTNLTSVKGEHNSSSMDIPLLVGIVIAALILILVVIGIVFITRRHKRTKNKNKSQPLEMGNPHYEYFTSAAANRMICSDTTNQTVTYSPVYEIPKIEELPQKGQPEPIYIETEPEYDDAIYAQEKLEEYQAAKRPVYAKINKNR